MFGIVEHSKTWLLVLQSTLLSFTFLLFLVLTLRRSPQRPLDQNYQMFA